MRLFGDKDTKTFNLSEPMMADLLFCLKPMKERQMEYIFWLSEVEKVKRDILKDLSIDQTKWAVDWAGALRTGKLICKKMPEPKVEDKNGEPKK